MDRLWSLIWHGLNELEFGIHLRMFAELKDTHLDFAIAFDEIKC
jgi:hypothetical protein